MSQSFYIQIHIILLSPLPSSPLFPDHTVLLTQEVATSPSEVPFSSARVANDDVTFAISSAFARETLVSNDGLNKGSMPLGNCPCIYLFMNASKGAPPRHTNIVTTALPWLSSRIVRCQQSRARIVARATKWTSKSEEYS